MTTVWSRSSAAASCEEYWACGVEEGRVNGVNLKWATPELQSIIDGEKRAAYPTPIPMRTARDSLSTSEWAARRSKAAMQPNTANVGLLRHEVQVRCFMKYMVTGTLSMANVVAWRVATPGRPKWDEDEKKECVGEDSRMATEYQVVVCKEDDQVAVWWWWSGPRWQPSRRVGDTILFQLSASSKLLSRAASRVSTYPSRPRCDPSATFVVRSFEWAWYSKFPSLRDLCP
ncbi:hypothetical protein B0H10DRAFT_1964945 [Mycena sp. CBHHK59/15]|nr:hypothetical protein B0H10DRAFT_1964945 [Mycena sp. CBHHK59/15]